MQASGRCQSLGTLHGISLQLPHLTCMIGVLSQCHSASVFSVGVHPNIVRRCGAVVPVVDIGGEGGGTVETRVEQNWEIPAVCWQQALCFTLSIDSHRAEFETFLAQNIKDKNNINHNFKNETTMNTGLAHLCITE